MAEETLITAARRVLRFIRIDEAHGGFIQTDTSKALDTLEKQLRQAIAEEEAKNGTAKTNGEL